MYTPARVCVCVCSGSFRADNKNRDAGPAFDVN